jgi:hypothetical protein
MLIHQIQGPEDAVMRAPITPAPNAAPTADEAETPLLTDQPAAAPAPPQTSTPPAWMVRTRRIADAARSFVENMTDPDSKFCECPNSRVGYKTLTVPGMDRDYDIIRIFVFGSNHGVTSFGPIRDRRSLLVLGASDYEEREEGYSQGVAKTLCNWHDALSLVLPSV